MPNTTNKTCLVSRTQSPISATMGGETVMMSIERGNYYGLGEVGSRIWELLATPIKLDQLCDQLLAEYQVEPKRCQTEVIAFLNQLQDEGLVRMTDDESSAVE